MTGMIHEAVEEARLFLNAHQGLGGHREVRVVAPSAVEDCQLTLGTVRSLYALAIAAQGMHQKIAEAGAAYTAATGDL
jgi:hypothetical protein